MPTPRSHPLALITGGASGIGLSTARVLYAEGYAVLITGQNSETLGSHSYITRINIVIDGGMGLQAI
jgi:NAD(P)-dependent dehydrogenase (short-subunit alcohol dehydrogenase family)